MIATFPKFLTFVAFWMANQIAKLHAVRASGSRIPSRHRELLLKAADSPQNKLNGFFQVFPGFVESIALSICTWQFLNVSDIAFGYFFKDSCKGYVHSSELSYHEAIL